MARQNNTPALLMAHNGLAKLLKSNWPRLIGGVVDAPRLLSRLCEIYRDGLDQASQTLKFPPPEVPHPPPTATKVGETLRNLHWVVSCRQGRGVGFCF